MDGEPRRSDLQLVADAFGETLLQGLDRADQLHLGQGVDRRARSHLRSEEHTSELQSLRHLVCRLLLEKKNATARPSSTRELPSATSRPMSSPVATSGTARRELRPPRASSGPSSARPSVVLGPSWSGSLAFESRSAGVGRRRSTWQARAASRGHASVTTVCKSSSSPSARAIASASSVFFFNDTATTEIYTLSLHDALPI